MLDLPLRPYQLEAIDAALKNESLLLALVQGSGKTRTAIEIVKILAEEGSVTGGAIFCPSTLKYQWRDSELEKWDDPELAIVIDGPQTKRWKQYQEAHRYRYTILNYECLVNDWDLILDYLPIDFIIGDEITAIKGFQAKRSRRLKRLGKNCMFKFGLSGQPVENKPEELYSIMEFIKPDALGPFDKFDQTFIRRDRYGRPVAYRNLDLLHKTLGDNMFRRSRQDIEQYLPKRIETELPVHLLSGHAKLHEYIRNDLIDIAAGNTGGPGFDLATHYGKAGTGNDNNKLKGLMMARITAMRLLVSHPQLLLASAKAFDDPESKTGSAYASALVKLGVIDKLLPESQRNRSAKLDVLLGQIDTAIEESPTAKIVVFSVFKPMQVLISEALTKSKIQHVKMTGETPAVKRQEAINAFNNDPNVRVFLSTDAGAYGVNLDKGTHLICYDFPWSAGALQQRVARIDRTSTEHSHINIVYLYVAGSIDEYQLGVQRQKAKIADAWVDGRHFNEQGAMNLDMDNLMKFMEVPINYV